ncbi:MAG: hypothetical protein OXQ94_08285 [Gemmatimonadota bacterium]|nr:hypothetical protein [Gemmatimonadota bacterium]
MSFSTSSSDEDRLKKTLDERRRVNSTNGRLAFRKQDNCFTELSNARDLGLAVSPQAAYAGTAVGVQRFCPRPDGVTLSSGK